MDYPKLIFGNQFLQKVIPEIFSAKRSIDIIVFYWSLDLVNLHDPVSRLVHELQNAVKRGVRVRIVVNDDGVGAKLENCGFDVRRVYVQKLLHPKVMIIDNIVGVIGSHNYTMSGMSLNLEVSVIVKFESDQNDLCAFFTNLWGV